MKFKCENVTQGVKNVAFASDRGQPGPWSGQCQDEAIVCLAEACWAMKWEFEKSETKGGRLGREHLARCPAWGEEYLE